MAALYIQLVIYLILAMGPVALLIAVFLWRLYIQDRKRAPTLSWLRLSFVLALEATITAVGSAYLATATVLRLSGHALPSEFAPVTVTIILALELVPAFSAVYLLSLRRRRGEARPPPFTADD